MTTEMKMETRSLASLRPAEYNPRVQLQPAKAWHSGAHSEMPDSSWQSV